MNLCTFQGGLAGSGVGPQQGDLLNKLVQLCERGLMKRGLGEEVYLAPVWQRLEQRMNPGQVAKQVFLEGGAAALLDHTDSVGAR